ncbi:MAG: hypothetical protein GX606_06885, partial [Elusimicrobia bacterium]|nr:hypothetical protein [Elusimicrobiota bacterium]
MDPLFRRAVLAGKKFVEPYGALFFLDLAVLLLYAGLTLFLALHHEIWRDEALIWLIARDASLKQIIVDIARTEIHPRMWYLMLVPFAKTGLPVVSMQVLHWFLAVMAAGLFILRAPFPRIVRYLFILSYFMFFEYAVIARSYVLGVLFLFLVAVLYRTRFSNPIRYLIVLALFFHTEITVFTLAGTLFLLFLFEMTRQRRWTPPLVAVSFLPALSGGAYFLQILSFSSGTSACQSSPGDLGFSNILRAVGHSFFVRFQHVSSELAIVLGVVFLLLFLSLMISRPKMVFLFLGGVSGLCYMFLTQYSGYLRHQGFLFLVVLFVWWIRVHDLVAPFRGWVADIHARWTREGERIFLVLLVFILCLSCSQTFDAASL